MKGLAFVPPRYERVQKLPWIPLEFEIDALISASGLKTSAFLQLLEETGVRCGEAWALKWIDIDFAQNTVWVTPEKESLARTFRMSSKLVNMLNRLPRKGEKVFGNGKLEHFQRTSHRARWKRQLQLPFDP